MKLTVWHYGRKLRVRFTPGDASRDLDELEILSPYTPDEINLPALWAQVEQEARRIRGIAPEPHEELLTTC